MRIDKCLHFCGNGGYANFKSTKNPRYTGMFFHFLSFLPYEFTLSRYLLCVELDTTLTLRSQNIFAWLDVSAFMEWGGILLQLWAYFAALEQGHWVAFVLCCCCGHTNFRGLWYFFIKLLNAFLCCGLNHFLLDCNVLFMILCSFFASQWQPTFVVLQGRGGFLLIWKTTQIVLEQRTMT